MRKRVQAVCILLIAVPMAGAMLSCAPARTSPEPSVVMPTAVASAPTEPASEPTTPVSSEPMPEDTVDAFYAAAARNDSAAVKATLATGFSIDSLVLARWGDPAHEIKLVTSAGKPGSIWIEVQESGGGLTGGEVTFTLIQQSAGWKISAWTRGKVTDQPGFGAAGIKEQKATSGDEDKVVKTVAIFIEARMMGDTNRMRAFATARMERRQSSLFKMQFGGLTKWAITDVYPEGDHFIAVAREKWKSGTKIYRYVVVVQNGKARVDERR